MFYYYGYNDSHSISGGKRNKEDYSSKSFKRSIKRYKNLLDRKLGGNNWVQSVIGFNVLSLIHCSGSWSASTRNIIKNFSYHNHARWWLRLFFKLWNRTHGGGVIVEFLKLFYKLSNAWQKICIPTRIPRGPTQNCHTIIDSFFASIRKPYLDRFTKLRIKTPYVLIPPITWPTDGILKSPWLRLKI